jgi:hypothetical protein
VLFGRLRSDFTGQAPAQFWRGGNDPVDTRLSPGVTSVSDFVFSADLFRVRVRLLYRRFWLEVTVAKGWSDRDIVVFEDHVAISRQSPNAR